MYKKKKRQWADYGLPLASLVLLGLPFFKQDLGWLIVIGLLPYLWYLKNKFHYKSTTGIWLVTWLLGFFFLILVCSWLIGADARSWTQLGGMSLNYLVFIIWFLLGLFLSIGFVLLGWLIKFAIKRGVKFERFLALFPFLWVGCEFVRSFIFSLLSYGTGAKIGAFWNFGALGYGLTATPLVYIARIGGLSAVSFLAVALNVIVLLLIQRRFRCALCFALPLLVIFGLSILPTKTSQHIRAVTVQLASADTNYYDALAAKLTNSVPRADLMVLPEYSFFFEYGTPQQHRAVTQKVFADNNGVLVYSQKGPALNGKQTNQLVAATPAGHILDAQIKSFIVPTGEYIPWLILGGLNLTGQKQVQGYFDASVGVASAKIREHVIHTKNLVVGGLACSGVIAADYYRYLTNQGAQILTNSASLNEFSNTPIYHEQARQFARFIAIANHRPFVQSARGGLAYIVDENGNFIYSGRSQGLAIGAANLETNTTKNPYVHFGEWVAYLSLIVMSGWLISPLLKKLKTKKMN